MPPVVTGAVVAVIGLNLAPIAVKGISGSAFDTWIGIATIVAVGLVAVRAPGLARRLPILLGGLAGYLLYAALANGAGPRQADRLRARSRPRRGSACRRSPRRCSSAQAIALIAPVAIVLVAENLGHVKAVAAMTGAESRSATSAARSSATASRRWSRARAAAPASRRTRRTSA